MEKGRIVNERVGKDFCDDRLQLFGWRVGRCILDENGG